MVIKIHWEAEKTTISWESQDFFGLQHKILKGKEKPLKSAYGFNYVLRKVGRDRPAIVTFKEEKLIIINLDHDLIKNLHGLRPLQKNMILCTLLARGHFHILESFRNVVSYEEYVDNMVSTAISKITEWIAMNSRFCLHCRYGFRKGSDYKQVFSKNEVLLGRLHIGCVTNFEIIFWEG